MNSVVRFIAAGAIAAAMVASPAVAQHISLTPAYGTVALNTGFNPDPARIDVQSGGPINAQTINQACQGFIADAPSVRLNYQAGTLPLIISVASDADTTLVINGPDGAWYCDDDSGRNRINPSLRFETPTSGQYDIWVGTYGNASNQPAQLNISELSSQ